MSKSKKKKKDDDVLLLTQQNRLGEIRAVKGDLRVPREQLIDGFYRVGFYTARLYNVGLYNVRQHYFETEGTLNYESNYHLAKENENYRFLLSDTAQPILKRVHQDMASFFGALRAKLAGKSNVDKVRLPNYKDKSGITSFSICGRSVRRQGDSVLINPFKNLPNNDDLPKKLRLKIPENLREFKINELRFVPRCGDRDFDIEWVYERPKPLVKALDLDRFLSLDLGLDNLAAAFDPQAGQSFLYDGRRLKSINHFFNKEKARLQSAYDKHGVSGWTKRLETLSQRRRAAIDDYFNRVVAHITDYCVKHNIGTLVVGDFAGIKQEINIGKRNNQNFVSIPHWKLKRKLKSQCALKGIDYQEQPESYTSKTSFVDDEAPRKHEIYAGKRTKRGLFRTAKKLLVNSDTNGAAQILRRYIESKRNVSVWALLDRDRACKGVVNRPVRLTLSDLLRQSRSKPTSVNEYKKPIEKPLQSCAAA